MKIGGHVSVAGGVDLAIQRALSIGANCFQIFVTSPRQWRQTVITDQQVRQFKLGIVEHNLAPVFIHGMYLVNLATDNQELLEKSVDALVHALTVADQIGSQGVIFHIGSRKGRDADEAIQQVIKAVDEVLHRAQGKSQLIIENTAGQGGVIGSNFEELALIVKGVNSQRVKVCLDTCHLFAAGYDVRSPETLRKLLKDFDIAVSLERLAVMHANDSKFELGRHRDRHENIGEGEIGLAGFKAMLENPILCKLPWLLEVPGFDNTGPDKKNISILKNLVVR
ncbi:deoxyribonuclease IV [Candidatus Berkelbacteria bacterium]|nr:deoxyribonuclease IV [Candidatus Berkelbacteria bacterium]